MNEKLKIKIYDAILDIAQKHGLQMANGGEAGHDISFKLQADNVPEEKVIKAKAEMDLAVERLSREYDMTISRSSMKFESKP